MIARRIRGFIEARQAGAAGIEEVTREALARLRPLLAEQAHG